MHKEPTCEQRIQDQLNGRLDDIAQAKTDEQRDELREGVLAFTKTVTIRIELSTGGPADWFEIQVSPDTGEAVRGSYHFSDWWDHAEVALSDQDMKRIVDLYFYGDPAAFIEG